MAAHRRSALERLARYVLRGPLAKERIERRGNKVALGFKRPWSDGTTEILLTPMEFTEKLAALVPPPRMNTVVYAGVFAANHRLRKEVVPKRKREAAAVVARRRARKLTRRPEAGGDGRDSWAELLKRVFAKDGFRCDECGKSMKLRAVVVGAPASLVIVGSLLRGTGPP